MPRHNALQYPSYSHPYHTSQFDLFERILYDRFVVCTHNGYISRMVLGFWDADFILARIKEAGATILAD